jgi:hypothetical protein
VGLTGIERRVLGGDALQHGARGAGLLHDVRQLVREQRAARRARRLVAARGEHDVAADGERLGLVRARKRSGLLVDVDPDLAEIDAEPGLGELTVARW